VDAKAQEVHKRKSQKKKQSSRNPGVSGKLASSKAAKGGQKGARRQKGLGDLDSEEFERARGNSRGKSIVKSKAKAQRH
jgi:hypothetical protein